MIEKKHGFQRFIKGNSTIGNNEFIKIYNSNNRDILLPFTKNKQQKLSPLFEKNKKIKKEDKIIKEESKIIKEESLPKDIAEEVACSDKTEIITAVESKESDIDIESSKKDVMAKPMPEEIKDNNKELATEEKHITNSNQQEIDIDSIKKEAFQDGYNQCLHDTNSIRQIIINEIQEEIRRDYDDGINAISLAIAKKLSLNTITDKENPLIIKYIESIANKFNNSIELQIKVNPKFFDYVSLYFNNCDQNIKFISDINISEMDCKIVWQNGYSFFSIEEKINDFLIILSDI